MSDVHVDTPVPDFECPDSEGNPVRLSDFAGQKVLLFFYPRANTPGCTREGQDFRDRHAAFRDAGTVVLGISRDGVRAQANFRAKHDFPFPLLSDRDEAVCRRFGVLREKTLYGRRVMSVERSSFLIDRAGVLRREWRGLKVEGHADEALAAARELG